jgi:uncharacterized membrane protein YoaK (UPF0700 family)
VTARRLAPEHQFTIGLLILTGSTGAIDAVSYLALDRVFTGNMTGNVLFLGFGLVGIGGIPFLNNAIALIGFIVGSIVSGRIIGRNRPKGLPVSSRWVLGTGAAIIVFLAVFWLTVGTLAHIELLIVTGLLAVVMGAQVSAVKPIGNSDVTTIVVTNTVANLARDSRLAGGKGEKWLSRLGAVVAMGVGAAIGAAAVHWSGGPAALVAAAIIFSLGTLTLVWATRRHREHQRHAEA